MDQSLMERFLGPSTDFFLFNQNDVSVAPIDKKTCLLTKRNVIATTQATSAALAVINNCTKTNPGTKTANASYSASKLKPYKGAKTQSVSGHVSKKMVDDLTDTLFFGMDCVVDQEEVSKTMSPLTPKKKLSSSSYTILNKSSYLEDTPVKVEPALAKPLEQTNQANENEENSEAGSNHDTYDKSEGSEKMKTNEDSSLMSDSSDNEICKFL